MWYTAGGDVSLAIDYKVDGQFIIPDSAAFQVHDLSGALLLSGSLPALTTTETLVVPAAQNLVASGNLFASRFITISFLHELATYQTRLSYQLSPFVPMTATASQVRAELGLDYSELPDEEVDVHAAYFHLVATVGAQFSAAFQLGNVQALAANQAVVVQAALDLSGSLTLRTAISSRAEDHQFSRSATVDFEAITLSLRQKLARLLQATLGTVASAGSIFQLSNPTDVITAT